MAEPVDANRVSGGRDPGSRSDGASCDVLRGADGPVYFLLEGVLYVVHEIIDQWIEPGRSRRTAGSSSDSTGVSSAHPLTGAPPYTEHWLLVASAGRFGPPAIFRLLRSPVVQEGGPDIWTVRAERL